jgi:hypothetical protein
MNGDPRFFQPFVAKRTFATGAITSSRIGNIMVVIRSSYFLTVVLVW